MIPVLDDNLAVSADVRQFFQELRHKPGFTGELALDSAERLIQSTDNSIYQVVPQGVAYPRSTADVSAIMKLMDEERYSTLRVAPRGGGTGTNGQALTDAIVVDTSKYMNRILEVNTEKEYAVVQPGVVLDQLNKELKKSGYFFAPMVSTSSRATIGGMCASDSSGIGSLLYGKTSDHLQTVTMVLANGHVFDSFAMDDAQQRAMIEKGGAEEKITKTVKEIVTSKRKQIVEKFPKLNRFMTGYNLLHALQKDGRLNLNYIISGSEGTLALFTELKVKIMKKPAHEKVVVCKFNSFEAGLRSASYIVDHLPTGVETIDGNIVNLARNHNIWNGVARFFQDPGDEKVECVNYVQFTGHSESEVQAKVDKLVRELEQRVGKPGELNSFLVAKNQEDLNALWGMRKKGVGLLGSKPGERRPQAFVEDAAVSPEKLADFIMDFRRILDQHGLDYGMFGHIDAGCLHVRPALDLKQESDRQLIRAISDKINQLALKYGGVLWGEHGKGYRGEYLPDYFGPDLYEDLRRIKTVFDPKNKLNPGKFCTPIGSDEKVIKIDEVALRGDFDKQIPLQVKQHYQVALNCNGNGSCFNHDPDDVMCPSYRFSRSRLQSPKGRASLVREWLRQLSNAGYDPSEIVQEKSANLARAANSNDFSHHVYDSMKECLSCKACTGQCPIKVDIPELKAKFLNHYYSRYKRPKRDLLVRDTEKIHHKLSRLPWLYNLPLQIPGVKKIIELLTGMIDPPKLSSPSVSRLLKSSNAEPLSKLEELSDEQKLKSVIIVQDPLTSFYEADLVQDHIEFFNKIGVRVFVLPYMENGKAKHVKGFLKEFHKTASSINEVLNKYSRYGVSYVTIEPAVALTYREEFPKYLGEDNVNYRVLMIQEFLVKISDLIKPTLGEKNIKINPDKNFTLFGHCGEKTAAPSYSRDWQECFRLFGLNISIEKTGCCGMAGVYGHEKEHEKSSAGIYKMHWKDNIDSLAQDAKIPMVTGASCRSQLKRLESMNAKHPVSILNEIF